MAEVTVTCGCGRKMTQRGSDPKGTYRCGCGAKFTVTVTVAATCAGMGGDGERCRFRPVRESAQWGIALCREHMQGYQAALDLIRDADVAREVLWRAEDLLLWQGRGTQAEHDAKLAARRKAYARQSVVYYVRIRDTIKIGTSGNMETRMRDLFVDEVLATEPGGKPLEEMRHQQFAHLQIRGERFRPAHELMSHIAMIRGHFGEPQITSYTESQAATAP